MRKEKEREKERGKRSKKRRRRRRRRGASLESGRGIASAETAAKDGVEGANVGDVACFLHLFQYLQNSCRIQN